jgi:hypothetical protein
MTESETHKIKHITCGCGNKELLKDNLEKVQTFLIRETDFDREEYNGECEKFGEKGWVIAQRVFEYGSRVSLFVLKDNATNPPNGGEEFRPEKFIHCFLNQLGSNDVFYKSVNGQCICDETLFHFDRYFERMAVKEEKTLEQAKDVIKKLLEQGYGAEYFQLI